MFEGAGGGQRLYPVDLGAAFLLRRQRLAVLEGAVEQCGGVARSAHFQLQPSGLDQSQADPGPIARDHAFGQSAQERKSCLASLAAPGMGDRGGAFGLRDKAAIADFSAISAASPKSPNAWRSPRRLAATPLAINQRARKSRAAAGASTARKRRKTASAGALAFSAASHSSTTAESDDCASSSGIGASPAAYLVRETLSRRRRQASVMTRILAATESVCGGRTGARYCSFAAAPGSTAATPSGLMLKAKNTNGSPPGFPHW